MKEFSLTEALANLSNGAPVPKPKIGRSRKIENTDTILTLRKMKAQGADPKHMAVLLGVSVPTVYRYLNHYEIETDGTPPEPVTRNCSVCKWIDGQPETDKLAFEIAEWVNSSAPRNALHTVLKQGGLTASETTFRNHVRQCVLQETSNVAS